MERLLLGSFSYFSFQYLDYVMALSSGLESFCWKILLIALWGFSSTLVLLLFLLLGFIFYFLLHFPCFIRRRQWHPTPVLLRGKSYGRRSLVGWVHEVVKSRTWLSDFTFTFLFHPLEKEMATHSSVLAWRISGTGEPGGLLSMGSHRVGLDWSDLAAAVMQFFNFKIQSFDLGCNIDF